MDAAQGHLIASIAVGQVLPVFCFGGTASLEPGHRNVVLVAYVWRVGEGPEVFPGGQRPQFPLDFLIIAVQGSHRLGGAVGHGSIDLGLVHTEVPGDVIVFRERVGGVRQEAVAVHTQALLFQSEISGQQEPSYLAVLDMKHDLSLLSRSNPYRQPAAE